MMARPIMLRIYEEGVWPLPGGKYKYRWVPHETAPRPVTATQFCRDNVDAPSLCRHARRLRVGQSFTTGGGAAVGFKIVRVK